MTTTSAPSSSLWARMKSSRFDAADLLLAFEDELHVHRQPAVLLQVRFDRLEVHEDLPLVVGRRRARRSRRRGSSPRTAATPTAPADRPAARRSGRRTESSARPARRASRRRPPDFPACRSAARSAGRCAASRRRTTRRSAARRRHAAGSALMLGMASSAFSSSRYRSRLTLMKSMTLSMARSLLYRCLSDRPAIGRRRQRAVLRVCSFSRCARTFSCAAGISAGARPS